MAVRQTQNLDLGQLRQFGSLELLARQVVEGFIVGLHKSPFHGFSVEFAEHRLYNQGESTRHIDWKLYGRTDKLFVKRYEEETNLRCMVVLDTSSSMHYPQEKDVASKLEFSVYAAASMIYMLKSQRDAAGLCLFSDQIEQLYPARSSAVHIKMLYNELERLLTQQRAAGTSATSTLHTIAESVHKRSLVVIFSDMFDNGPNDELFHALQHLRYNQHEVILFHVFDKKHELEFEFENRPYIFIDMESGEKIKLTPSEIREEYVARTAAFRHELKLRCSQYRIDYVEADIRQGFRQILLPYLLKRIKMK